MIPSYDIYILHFIFFCFVASVSILSILSNWNPNDKLIAVMISIIFTGLAIALWNRNFGNVSWAMVAPAVITTAFVTTRWFKNEWRVKKV